jgi:peptidoglycan/xylan/chitin deacetylase (PgdA/CDA1 family)
MLNVLKNSVVPAIFSRISPALLLRVAGTNPTIAYYHIVSDQDVPHVKHLYNFRTTHEFRRDLDVFLKLYRPITLHELLTSVRTRERLPENAFLLTFDDGFREMYDVVAPILVEKGISATFFLTTAFIDNADMAHHNKVSLLIDHLDRSGEDAPANEIMLLLEGQGIVAEDVKTGLRAINYGRKHLVEEIAKLMGYDFGAYLKKFKPHLTSEQIRKLLAMGFSIGGHSVDHPAYADLRLEEQLSQTLESVGAVRSQFGLSYGAFAFPHGAAGVSRKFFAKAFATGELDVSFGTGGMLKDSSPRHFERFSCEYDRSPAERTIARNYARSLFKALMGAQTVRRD